MISISRAEYQQRVRMPYWAPHNEEQEWWRSESGHLLGVVTLETIDNDWSFVVLGRDTDGTFKAIDTEVSLRTRAMARAKLTTTMQAMERTGLTVFSQDDPASWQGGSPPTAADLAPADRLQRTLDELRDGQRNVDLGPATKTREMTAEEKAEHPNWFSRVCLKCGKPRFDRVECGGCGDPAAKLG